MTNLKNIISTTEARRRIFELTDAVQKSDQYYTLTENGRAKAVLVSSEEFSSMQSTIEALAEDPDLRELVAEADKAVASGDFSNYISFDDFLKEEGYVVAEKGGEYVVQHSVKPRSPKKLQKAPTKNKRQG